MAAPDDITRLALRTLEDVYAQAEVGVVEPSWGVRMALHWLVRTGVMKDWQASTFANDMSDPHIHEDFFATTCRTTSLMAMLRACYHRLGWPEPEKLRRHWARIYALELVDMGAGTAQLPCMCNRYQPGDRHRIDKLFGARPLRDYNDGPEIVHPREVGAVVRLVDGQRVIEPMTWGFPVQLRGKDNQLLKPKPVNNARFDKLGGFWKRWAAEPAQRCLIPTVRFAEAEGRTGHMTTTWLSVRDQPVFAWAGLWRESDEWGACYTGVMTDAAIELMDIHDRCPVILEPYEWDTWLSAPLADLRQFDRPLPLERMKVYRSFKPWKEGRVVPPDDAETIYRPVHPMERKDP